MNCHTGIMVQRVVVTLDKKTVDEVDRWVREGQYPNRSRAVQAAVNLLADRDKRTRLARELSKVDRGEEQRMAEEGLGCAEQSAAWERLQRRAARGDRERFLAVMDQVPDVEPKDYDRP
jgi:Arc/MetJ-type ribon-helix-helix transcriptional regulator